LPGIFTIRLAVSSRLTEEIDIMKVAVVDGQGGGIGKAITEKLRKEFGEKIEIYAFGTNALATAALLKAGANEGATGENAIIQNMSEMDIIVGPLGIIVAHSMLGELTPRMAEAIAKSKARKLLLPINRVRIDVIGAKAEPLPHLVNELLLQVKTVWKD
jgi:NAD(P)-dependent dehydrogenase (short-subunit alcohol dehydrogenase family)